MLKGEPLVSIIIPVWNTRESAEKLINELLEQPYRNIEIIAVDDGSTDKTWDIIEYLHAQTPMVKGKKFIRNYGNQKAIVAGLEGVRNIGCDCVVSIDADLQQDELAIERFVDEYVKGFDVVLGIRNNRKTDGFIKKTTAVMFYKLMNILGAKIPINHSDYRLVSKKALDVMNLYPEKDLFLRGFFYEVGLKTTTINFDVKPRMAGTSKFNFMSLMALALNGITSYSIVPLRIIAVLGFIMFVLSIIVGLETIYEKIFLGDSPNGYATMIIMLTFFGGLQIFCLGVIGEYVGQVYREVKARPRYITDKELL